MSWSKHIMLSHSVEKLDRLGKLPANKEAKSQECAWMEKLEKYQQERSAVICGFH